MGLNLAFLNLAFFSTLTRFGVMLYNKKAVTSLISISEFKWLRNAVLGTFSLLALFNFFRLFLEQNRENFVSFFRIDYFLQKSESSEKNFLVQ